MKALVSPPIDDESHPFPAGSSMVTLDIENKGEYRDSSRTTHPNPVSGLMTLQQYYRAFIRDSIRDGLADNTIKSMELYLFGSLSHSVEDCIPSKLTLLDYAKVRQAGKEHGVWGEYQSAVMFKKFLHYLARKRVRVGLDWRELKMPHKPEKAVEYLTKEEVEKVRAFLPGNEEGLRTRAMFELGLSCGLRIGEICSLDKVNIHPNSNELDVVNNKTGKLDTISFTVRAREAIEAYLLCRTDEEDALFVSMGQGRLKTVTARATLRKYRKTLNLGKHIHWHLLRKSFVSHLIFSNKMDIKEVQTRARHSDPVITLKHYTALREEEAKKKQLDIMEGI